MADNSTILEPTDFKSIKQEITKLMELKSFDEIKALMETLKNWKATTEALRTTKIGVFVTDLRKHENCNEELKQLSKDLILKWKKDVGRTSISVKTESGSKTIQAAAADPTISASSSAEFASTQERNVTIDSVHVAQKDKIRRKCTEILYSALATGSELASEDIIEIAECIEKVAFDHFKSVSDQYKSKLRSLVSNLRDKHNPMLRHKVLSGAIPAEKFALMTAEEMMSKDRKAIVEEAQKANLKDTLSAKPNQAATDIFKCGRCKQRKCTYYQMQTRSADEPMTTFGNSF